MPGIFGTINCEPCESNYIAEYYTNAWGKTEIEKIGSCVIGMHSFYEYPLIFAQDGKIIAVDGEISLYENIKKNIKKNYNKLFEIRNDEIELTSLCKGNIAVYDDRKNVMYLGSEISGGFPLYYYINKNCFIFSSFLKPIKNIIDLTIDHVGLVEFLRSGYFLAGRTFFREVKRLLPGEILRYDGNKNELKLIDKSEAWIGNSEEHNIEAIVEKSIEKLNLAKKRCYIDSKVHSILFSAGWDSRLILALMKKDNENVQVKCYFHGDLESRESRIAEKLCKETGVDCLVNALDDSLFDLDFLGNSFKKSENVVFPHFHKAGIILKEHGVDSASCGVFGEMIGGKYGWRIMKGSIGRAGFFASKLLGIKRKNKKEDKYAYEEVRNEIELKSLPKPWYLTKTLWNDLPNIKDEINSDISFELKRLKNRGVITKDQIYEAYISEHRATYHTMAQLLSLRSSIDIINIFCDKEFFIYASKVPMDLKYHNRLTKRLIHNFSPDMLNYPTSAILVSGKRNLFVQEGSRLFRKIYEDTKWKRYYYSKEKKDVPHFSWPNFEFLRSGGALMELGHDLNCQIFDRNAIIRLINEAKSFKYKLPMHQVSSQLLKIYTADLMFR